MKGTRMDPTFQPNFKLVTSDKGEVAVNAESLAFHSQVFADMLEVCSSESKNNIHCPVSETKEELETLFAALVDWEFAITLPQFLTLAVLYDKYQFYLLEQLITAKRFKGLNLGESKDIANAFKVFFKLGNENIWRYCAEKLVQSSTKLILELDQLGLELHLQNIILIYYARRSQALLDNVLFQEIKCPRSNDGFNSNFNPFARSIQVSQYATPIQPPCRCAISHISAHTHNFSHTTVAIRTTDIDQEDLVNVLVDKLKSTCCVSCLSLLEARMQQIQARLDAILFPVKLDVLGKRKVLLYVSYCDTALPTFCSLSFLHVISLDFEQFF